MWDPQEFERHWQAEFPGKEAPVMRLDSVLDIEQELERCKLNLKRLQQVLAEEKFKVLYLQTALAREKEDLGCGRLEGGDRGSGGTSAEEPAPAGPERAPPPREEEGAAGSSGDPPHPERPDPEMAAKSESTPYVCPDLPNWPGAAGEGGAVLSWTAAIHQQMLQPSLLFRLREDCAPPGHNGTAPCARGEEPALGTGSRRGSEEGELDASGADDGGDSSDHDFEMVDLNEKFDLGHLLMTPYRFGARDEVDKPGRACCSHRWMHLIPRGRRKQQRRSRDLEQLETEGKDRRSSPSTSEEHPRRGAREHLPPWRRKRFPRMPERDSPYHSSPETVSDCSHNSSDHDDVSSAESFIFEEVKSMLGKDGSSAAVCTQS